MPKVAGCQMGHRLVPSLRIALLFAWIWIASGVGDIIEVAAQLVRRMTRLSEGSVERPGACRRLSPD